MKAFWTRIIFHCHWTWISPIFVGLMVIYLNVAPSLELAEIPSLAAEKVDAEQKAMARLDLEKKVYPEIQARLAETNEWLFRKFTLAGGLLSVFLLQVLWPFFKPSESKPSDDTQDRAKDILPSLLKSNSTCAVLGLACIVALFIDIHSRRSVLVIHQLGAWATYYGVPMVGGVADSGFKSWEQFIRLSTPAGMHRSLIDALQTGNLNLITVVFILLYQWSFQEVCRKRLDGFNRLIYALVLFVLLLFILGAHWTSATFKFADYGAGPVFSKFWCYFLAWCAIACVFALWDIVQMPFVVQLLRHLGIAWLVVEWRFTKPIKEIPPGSTLRIIADQPFILHSGFDDWTNRQDTPSVKMTTATETIEYVDILVPLENANRVLFTFNWGDRWEHCFGGGFDVEIIQ